MAFLARLTMFLLGALFVGVVVTVIAFRLPHAWMPLLFGSCMVTLIGTRKWRPSGAALQFQGASWILGSLCLWLLTSNPRIPALGTLFNDIANWLAGGVFVEALILSLALPKKLRASGLYLFALLLLGLLVSYASGPPGRLDAITFILEKLGLTGQALATVALVARKVGHFVLYGTIAWVALRAALSAGEQKRGAALFALSSALIFSSFDELRQSTTLVRTGSPWDMLLDLAGATTFILLTRATKGVRSQ